ncbi:MAG: SET domain-containing protein [Planctomycetes bacterium]|nr:SET domain-containing protein [Planctomycetota bacterium]
MGRGVYSTIPIRRGAIVEIAPVIPLTAKDWKAIKDTTLQTYVFAWGENGKSNAIPLGFGGLFNHSDDPNMSFWLNVRKQSITFRAKREIAAGEQLTIDYLWNKKDRKKYLLPPPE